MPKSYCCLLLFGLLSLSNATFTADRAKLKLVTGCYQAETTLLDFLGEKPTVRFCKSAYYKKQIGGQYYQTTAKGGTKVKAVLSPDGERCLCTFLKRGKRTWHATLLGKDSRFYYHTLKKWHEEQTT